MLRKLSFLAALIGLLLSSTPLHAQDQQQSLGDLARQLRKDKEKNNAQPKTVITDDNMPSSKGMGGLGDLGGSQGSPDSSTIARGTVALDKAEATLNKLAPMDRATLAKVVLLDNDVDFPGRRDWEEKLYSAKQQYVSHGRELFHQMRQLLADVQSMRSSSGEQGKLSPNDPRAQELLRKLQEIIQEAVRTDREFQAVVVEGWDRAKQANARPQ